jgi:hypothetical protein
MFSDDVYVAPNLPVAMEAALEDLDAWDDTALCAIFNMSVASHKTKHKSVKGESKSGGLSRKEKKKLIKDGLEHAKDTGVPVDEKVQSLMEERIVVESVPKSLDHLNAGDRAFVDAFLTCTDTSTQENPTQSLSQFHDVVDSSVTTYSDGQSHMENDESQQQHHHYYYHHNHYYYSNYENEKIIEDTNTSTFTSHDESVPHVPSDTMKAWNEMMAAHKAYDTSLERYNMLLRRDKDNATKREYEYTNDTDIDPSNQKHFAGSVYYNAPKPSEMPHPNF